MEYTKCLVEVDEILKYLSKEDLEKIPDDIRDAIKKNKDKEYTFKYDEAKKLNEQDISRDTVVILSYLNIEYLLSQEQKELMDEIHKLNDDKKESSKQGADDIFKKKEESTQENITPLVEVKKLKWHEKILPFLRGIFSKSK